MKITNLKIIVLVMTITLSACTQNPAEVSTGEVVSSITCIDDACSEAVTHAAGNFTMGTIATSETEEAGDLPAMTPSEKGDFVTMSCSAGTNTSNGAAMLNCNLGAYEEVHALCVDGVVGFSVESDLERVYLTGCASIDVNCDDFGFYLALECREDVVE